MGRKSSIQELPPAVKEAVDDAVREGRATIDDIVALIRGHGADASRSAVGRYKALMDKRLADYREAQAVATVWIDKSGLNTGGDVGLLVGEAVKTLAFQAVATAEGVDATDPERLMLLAKALKDLESARKTNADVKAKAKAEARAELLAEQAEKVKAAEAELDRVRKGGGLSAEDTAALRRALLDVVV